MPGLLSVQDLAVNFRTRDGAVAAVRNLSFGLEAGQILGIVGESGSGKSVTGRSILRLVPHPGIVTAKRLAFRDTDILTAREKTLREIRGRHISMVMQDPKFSLNPVMPVGRQIAEAYLVHADASAAAARQRALELLAAVRIRDPERVYDLYPHEVSGGMGQRIMIAMMLVPDPDLLIADEPTSALDVSIQAQILNLFMDLQQATGTAYVFISHNLALVEHVAHEVLVMYFGSAVEQGPKAQVLGQPLHPYTQALLSAVPALRPQDRRRRAPLQGEVPSPLAPPTGCAFHTRCPLAQPRCREEVPLLRDVDGRRVACHVVAA